MCRTCVPAACRQSCACGHVACGAKLCLYMHAHVHNHAHTRSYTNTPHTHGTTQLLTPSPSNPRRAALGSACAGHQHLLPPLPQCGPNPNPTLDKTTILTLPLTLTAGPPWAALHRGPARATPTPPA